MYMTPSFDFCMRYLTKNTVTGCSSDKSGNRGRLINTSSLQDLTSFKYSYPIIVLIPAQKDILDFVIFQAPMIVGVLIDGKSINRTTHNHFTEVNTCPEDLIDVITSSSNCSIRKNKYGIDFRGRFINKPIFLLKNQTVIDEMRKLSYLYNQQQLSNRKFIYAHMKSYAYGAKNAQICNRRSKSNYFGEAYFKHYSIKCRSPMINIIWSIFNTISVKQTRPPKSVIIFYTKIDFFSIFQPTRKKISIDNERIYYEDLDVGAQSTAFGVVTLLGLAWLLGKMNLNQLLVSHNNSKDLVFLFMNGQNWNYYGAFEISQIIRQKQFPYQIEKSLSLHPIEPEHIDIVINIDQLGIAHNHTYILYDNIHPFLEKYKEVSLSSITLEKISDTLGSLNDFRSLNISTVAMLTDAYSDMNPFFNSYSDTLIHAHDYLPLENHIYSLFKTICIYFNLSICLNELSIEIKQSLNNHINALFDCFLQSNCSKIIDEANQTNEFYFKEVLNHMKENFTFLQPILHQSDTKKYINNNFFYASAYIHDILLNSIAIRVINASETQCERMEHAFHFKIYQKATETCLYGSVDSINLIRTINEPIIDDRIIFTSNFDEPELFIYMIDNTNQYIITLTCGILLFICGFILAYFLTKLSPIILNQPDKFSFLEQ